MKVNIAYIAYMQQKKRIEDKKKEIGDGYTTILYTEETTRRNRLGIILEKR